MIAFRARDDYLRSFTIALNTRNEIVRKATCSKAGCSLEDLRHQSTGAKGNRAGHPRGTVRPACDRVRRVAEEGFEPVGSRTVSVGPSSLINLVISLRSRPHP